MQVGDCAHTYASQMTADYASKAYITTAIRLRYDYDTTTTKN